MFGCESFKSAEGQQHIKKQQQPNLFIEQHLRSISCMLETINILVMNHDFFLQVNSQQRISANEEVDVLLKKLAENVDR